MTLGTLNTLNTLAPTPYKNSLSIMERGTKGVRFRYKKTPPKRGLKNHRTNYKLVVFNIKTAGHASFFPIARNSIDIVCVCIRKVSCLAYCSTIWVVLG